MILEILTQLQISEQSVTTEMQLHVLSYVETEHGLHFKHLIHKCWFKLSNEYSDSCYQRHLTNLDEETENELRHAYQLCLIMSVHDRCTFWSTHL